MKRKISFNFEDKDFAFEEDSDLVIKLFYALGAALSEIQVFESSIIFLLSGIKSKQKNIALNEALKKDESKTLGALINELIKYIEAEEIKNMLEIIKNDRNYIVHNILRDYGWPVMSESKYKHAINEILQIREIMHKTTPIINKYISSNNILDIIDIDVLIDDIQN